MGVLTDSLSKTVSIFRQAQPVQKLDNPATIDLSPEMPGLVLTLAEIWD